MIIAAAKRALTLLAITTLVFVSGAGADDIKIPDMGSPADAILNKSQEAQIGRSIMRSIRMSGMVVEDPQVTEYINDIGHRLAAQTNEGDHEFTFFVVNDSRINAFALPGGYIGVHTGLIDATRNEDELAGVIAHEVAHVTQRHIARRVRAGNCYINRNMIGAVVGVQPFGGENLSGTGPKAGGPHYMLRFATERTLTVNTAAVGGNADLLDLND